MQFTKDTFGSDLEKGAPKSAKEAEDFGRAVASKHLSPMVSSQHYKVVIKALVKAAMQNYSVQDIRDLEACLAGLRSDKIKEENAAKLAKKGQWPLIPRPACVYWIVPI